MQRNNDLAGVRSAVITGTDTARAAEWFRALLSKHGVQLHPEAPFAKALDAVGKLAQFRAGVPVPEIDLVRTRAESLDVWFLAKAVHRALDRIEPAVGRRWDYFKGRDLCLSWGVPCSKERNTLWEVLVASLVGHFAGQVDLDGEPDVRFQWRKLKYGVACKVLYSDKPDQHLRQIQNGALNIQSHGRRGIVVVNVTNLVDHDYFSHQHEPSSVGESPAPDGRSTTNRLRDQVAEIAEAVSGKLNQKLRKTTEVGGIVFFAHAAGEAPPVAQEGSQDAWTLFSTCVFQPTQKVREADEQFIEAFEQSVTGVPGHIIP